MEKIVLRQYATQRELVRFENQPTESWFLLEFKDI